MGMAGRRKFSFALALVVFAATCMCVCTDSLSVPVDPSHKPHACCDVDHGQSNPKQAPANHDDCRACGLNIWSGARITAATTLHSLDIALPIAIPTPGAFDPFEHPSVLIHATDPAGPPNTLLSLHCQLTC
jgi:hypothetical protein